MMVALQCRFRFYYSALRQLLRVQHVRVSMNLLLFSAVAFVASTHGPGLNILGRRQLTDFNQPSSTRVCERTDLCTSMYVPMSHERKVQCPMA